jgi:hypothetical protein
VAVDADDGGLFGKGNGTGDAGSVQRGLVRQCGMSVEELEQHRLARDGVVKQLAADAALLERFVVQPPALHPILRADPFALSGEPGADLVQAGGVEQVSALGAQGAHEGVDVGISQTRDEGDAAGVDDPRPRAPHGANGVVVAGGEDDAVLDGERAAPR